MLSEIGSVEWSRRHAAHLLARTAFDVVPERVEELTRLTPDRAVARATDLARTPDPPPFPEWADPEDEVRPRALRQRGGYGTAPDDDPLVFTRRRLGRVRLWRLRLGDWWLRHLRDTSTPFREKLALFWHGHFATQSSIVKSGWAMWRQNELFRSAGAGPFRDLCRDVARDPAMLVYLDNASSRKESPNENFARELLELFTLGIGNYDEEDVRETARAFTGWTLDEERWAFRFRSDWHDGGEKQVLGRTGRLDGTDVIERIVDRPECARFVVRKLWEHFAYEDPEDGIVEELAETFHDEESRIAPVLEKMFLSRPFYSERAIRARIKSPVEWYVGILRSLDLAMPSPEWSNETLRALGQELFEPPNVAGWPEGRRWITASSLMERYRRAIELTARSAVPRGEARLPIDPTGLSREEVLFRTAERLFGIRPPDAELAEMRPLLADLGPDPAEWAIDERVRFVAGLLATARYQLT
jgi:hypothetical protein